MKCIVSVFVFCILFLAIVNPAAAADEDCSDGCNGIDSIPTCIDSLAHSFSNRNITPPLPNSNGYSTLSSATESLVKKSIDALVDDNDADTARSMIELPNDANLDYILCRDPMDSTVVRWEPRVEAGGTARFALRLSEARRIILGVPHGRSETHTLIQGVELFENLMARALIVSGSHRCANTTYSSCSGRTSVCGNLESFRSSDLAHNDNTIYQWVHEKIADKYSNDWVVSIHGKSGSGTIVSNGTTCSIAESTPAALLVSAIEADADLSNEGIKTCNFYPGAPKTTRELCGTTNVQGRYVNNSVNACAKSATSTTHRFIHLEQSSEVRSKLRVNIQSALSDILP